MVSRTSSPVAKAPAMRSLVAATQIHPPCTACSEARRRFFLILVGDEFKSGDGTQAFVALADLVLSTRDAAGAENAIRNTLAERTRVYQAFTDAAVSEQVARMVAMKSATDAAGDMIKQLTRDFNRARQSQITLELLDIVGGAEVLK